MPPIIFSLYTVVNMRYTLRMKFDEKLKDLVYWVTETKTRLILCSVSAAIVIGCLSGLLVGLNS